MHNRRLKMLLNKKKNLKKSRFTSIFTKLIYFAFKKYGCLPVHTGNNFSRTVDRYRILCYQLTVPLSTIAIKPRDTLRYICFIFSFNFYENISRNLYCEKFRQHCLV